MTKRERVMAAVAGSEVDRVPFSFWYHFPGGDRADEAFVRNEVEFAKRFDVDMLKVMHDPPFDLPGGALEVDSAEAFAELPLVDPTAGHFGKQLEALKAIKGRLGGDRPMVDTVFDSFAYAQKITGRKLIEYLEQEREAARAGLASVTESLVRWSDCCLDVVDGIFLACGAASASVLSAEVYEREILPLNIKVMEAAVSKAPLNVLHVHGAGEIHFGPLTACPAQIVNWSDRTTNVSIASGRRLRPDACLAAGIDEITAGSVSPADIEGQVEDAIEQLGGRRMIVACGCAVPTDAPVANLDAVRAAVMRAAGR